MSMLAELERIIRNAQRRMRGLEDGEMPASDMVLIELAAVSLDGVIASLRAADSDEGANIEAPEEPAASAH